MSLRKKTLLILAAALVALVVILYIISQLVLLDSFARLENQAITRNAQRTLNAIDDTLARLSASAADYARWDDTYAFIEDANPAYIETTLQDLFFVNLELNLMAFVNNAGETVFAKAVDLQSGMERPLPEGLAQALAPGSPLLDLPDPDSSRQGILQLPEGPMLVAARPILDSFARQPIRGALIFGQFLDAAKVQQLSESLRLPIFVHSVNSPQLPRDFQNALATLDAGSSVSVRPLDDTQIAGYTLVNDIYGQPALVVRVDMSRDIYAQGQASVTLFVALLVAAGLVFGALGAALLERFVLSRLTRLSADVNRISRSGSVAGRVSAGGDDELASLARDINDMLVALEKTQTNLRESDQRLRSIVNGAPILLWSVDRNGILTLLEGKGLETLGLDAAQGLGKPAVELFRNIPQVVEEMQRALKGDEFGSVVVVKAFTFDTRYVPLRGVDGAITGMIGVATDITERVMAETALNIAYEDLNRQNLQLERVQELFRSTLDQVSDAARRGAAQQELTDYLEFVQSEFDRLD